VLAVPSPFTASHDSRAALFGSFNVLNRRSVPPELAGKVALANLPKIPRNPVGDTGDRGERRSLTFLATYININCRISITYVPLRARFHEISLR
jgi:hypothetical protein